MFTKLFDRPKISKTNFLCSKTKNDIKSSIYQQNIFMLFRKTLTITFEEIHFLERRCLEEGGVCEIFCLYGQRLLEDDVNKKKCVYWRIYHILAFLYSFILDVHGILV